MPLFYFNLNDLNDEKWHVKYSFVQLSDKNYKMSVDEFMLAEIGIAKKFFQKSHLL